MCSVVSVVNVVKYVAESLSLRPSHFPRSFLVDAVFTVATSDTKQSVMKQSDVRQYSSKRTAGSLTVAIATPHQPRVGRTSL